MYQQHVDKVKQLSPPPPTSAPPKRTAAAIASLKNQALAFGLNLVEGDEGYDSDTGSKASKAKKARPDISSAEEFLATLKDKHPKKLLRHAGILNGANKLVKPARLSDENTSKVKKLVNGHNILKGLKKWGIVLEDPPVEEEQEGGESDTTDDTDATGDEKEEGAGSGSGSGAKGGKGLGGGGR